MNCQLGRPVSKTMKRKLPQPATAAKCGSGRGLIWTAGLAAMLLAAMSAQAQNPNNFGMALLGTTAGAQSVTVNSPSGGTVKTIEVLTMGAAGGDFSAGGGASTCPNATLGTHSTCTQSVTFTPSAPGVRVGAVVLLDSSGNVVGNGYISGIGKGGLGVLVTGNLVPVAGDGAWTLVDDGKQATSAQLNLPAGVALDGAGNMYIADSLHNRIRMVCGAKTTTTIFGTICAKAGIISTIAGNGNPAYTGDGGLASSATLSSPGGVAVDGAGNLFIADTGNNVIRVINAATGAISTLAGNSAGTVCGAATDLFGDGCPATQAVLDQPWGVTLDTSGNYYIADTFHHLIREVSVSTALIFSVAGTGKTAPDGSGDFNSDGILAVDADLNFPYAVAFDPQGNMYIPDSANDRVREVAAVSGVIDPASSKISTFAGTGTAGGSQSCTTAPTLASVAPLSSPEGVAVDAAGNVYIADTQNNAIRKVNASTGQLSSLVVNKCGVYYSGSGFTAVNLYGPLGLFLDGNGDLYVADYYNMIVREVQSNFAALDYISTPVRQNSQSNPVGQTLENDGNDLLDLTGVTAGTNSQLGTATTCVPGSPYLPIDSDCTVSAIFAPTVAGNPLTGIIAITDETEPSVTGSNSPLNIELVGNAQMVNSTTTTVSSTPNPSGFGQSVTFTVTVTTGSGTGNLTGTVSLVDTYNLTTTTPAPSLALSLNSAGTTGTATFTISTLGVGIHSIVASYSGDPGHFKSSSTDNSAAPYLQTVEEGTTTALTSSANPSGVGQSVTFSATVTSAGGGITPDGSVAFMDGTNTLATQPLAGSGASATATYATSALTNGPHQITAVYSGDSADEIQSSTSTVLPQDVLATATMGVSSSGTPSNYGTLVTFTATITSAATNPAMGTVNFYDNGVKIGSGTLAGNPATATFQTSTLVVGSHPITATYTGDNYNSAANNNGAPFEQVVNQTQTSTTVTASPTPGIAGGPETITATVKVISGSASTTGSVTFTSGTSTLGSATINATTGMATITSVLAPGTYNIVATYGGDANDANSVSTPALALTVNQATTKTVVTETPATVLVGAPITFSAKVTGTGGTPTGAVNFLSGSNVIGSANLNASGVATFVDTAGLAAGAYTVSADYLGDIDDALSDSNSISLTVGTIPTTTDLGTSTTGGTNPQVILVATVLASASGPTPTGTITFDNGSTEIGSATLDSSGVATLTPSLVGGTNYSIVASYGGDLDHSPSTSQPVSISGTSTGFSIAISPSTVSMAASQNATVAVNLTSNGGFSDNIGLGCSSLPAGVTCHFSNLSVSLPANGQTNAQLTIDTNSPLTGGTSAMNRGPGQGGVSLAGLFLPCSVLFGWLFWRLRKRHAPILTLVLVLALSAGALLATGCNGFSMGSVAPGTYVIQVTGTGTSSNVIHYQSETVTITK